MYEKSFERLNKEIAKTAVTAAIAYANHMVDVSPMDDPDDCGFGYYFRECLSDCKKQIGEMTTRAWVKGVF